LFFWFLPTMRLLGQFSRQGLLPPLLKEPQSVNPPSFLPVLGKNLPTASMPFRPLELAVSRNHDFYFKLHLYSPPASSHINTPLRVPEWFFVASLQPPTDNPPNSVFCFQKCFLVQHPGTFFIPCLHKCPLLWFLPWWFFLM